MKILTYIYGLFLVLAIVACSKEDDLIGGKVDFSMPYVIEDNPNDPIQHRRYEIYKKYDVPVFFNDTIKKTFVGEDHYGNPVYQYETLDMNWDFTSHTGGSVSYEYTYITLPEEQNEALDFVETYLSLCSERMRPFCLFVTGSAKMISGDQETEKEYFQNFRVLLLADVLGIADEEVTTRCKEMINSMVLGKVQNDADVVARFGSVSSTENWYEKPWKSDDPSAGALGCSYEYTDNVFMQSDPDCEVYTETSMAYLDDVDKYCDLMNIDLYDTDIGTEWVKVKRNINGYYVEPVNVNYSLVPDFTGMNVTDAVFLIESLGWKAQFEGHGRVLKQSVEPDEELEKGKTIKLVLGYGKKR